MSRTRVVLRTSGAVVLVFLAVALALLARDVLAWRGQTERADLAIAHYSQRDVSQPDTWLPVAFSREVLDASDDVELVEALRGVQRLRVSGGPEYRFDPPALDLARLELEFDDIATGHGSAEVRSRARQLHAILLFQQLILGVGSASTALDRTITELRSAVRIDPSNVDAQYDLESLLIIYKPIAIELAGELAYRRTNRGNIGGAGGSPGNTGATGGY
jgi:hypothetical protein